MEQWLLSSVTVCRIVPPSEEERLTLLASESGERHKQLLPALVTCENAEREEFLSLVKKFDHGRCELDKLFEQINKGRKIDHVILAQPQSDVQRGDNQGSVARPGHDPESLNDERQGAKDPLGPTHALPSLGPRCGRASYAVRTERGCAAS
jgi:hypothetical protein